MTCGDNPPSSELFDLCTTLACLQMQFETKFVLEKGKWTPDLVNVWVALGCKQAEVITKKIEIEEKKGLAF